VGAHHDVVVIGSGHNGLTCAAYLARAGLDVHVVEKDTVIGGATSTVERYPGHLTDRGSSAHLMIRHTGIPEELDLASHGLRYIDCDPWGFAPAPPGTDLPPIVFHRDLDIVCDRTVIRDLTLAIAMGPQVRMAVPAVLRYDLREDDDELKIASLQAHWELPPMLRQFLGNGLAALPAGFALNRALLANLGVGGLMGFLRGLRRPGPRQREAVVEALTALSVGDELGIRRSLGTAQLSVDLDELRTRCYGASWAKVIAAGQSVTATVHAADRRMVVIADFAGRAAIERLQVFG